MPEELCASGSLIEAVPSLTCWTHTLLGHHLLETLIASNSFLQYPLPSFFSNEATDAMTLPPGKRLAQYQIMTLPCTGGLERMPKDRPDS